MKRLLVIAGLVSTFAASSLLAGDRFEDTGYHGFTVRLELGASTLDLGRNITFLDDDDRKAAFVVCTGAGIRVGRNALLLLETSLNTFQFGSVDYSIGGFGPTFSLYLSNQFFLQVGPHLGLLQRQTDYSGQYDKQTLTDFGGSITVAGGYDVPFHPRWSVMLLLKGQLIQFEGYSSNLVAFTIGIGFMP